MLKVLIVDDEIWVSVLIQNSIDWKAHGMEVVALSHDGFDALEKIQSLSPDIVISDVRMPGLDGVLMVKMAREAGCDSHFIMLSGYSDFEYVQGALKYNVSDYLLKPFDEKVLLETLLKVKVSIEDANQKRIDYSAIINRLDKSVAKLRSSFLIDLLNGANLTLPNLDTINADYELAFIDGLYRVIYFKNISTQDSFSPEIISTTETVFRNEFGQYCEYLVSQRIYYGYVIILNYTEKNSGHVESIIQTACSCMMHILGGSCCAKTSIGIGSPEPSLLKLSNSMNSAMDSAACHLHFGCGKIYDFEKFNFTRPDSSEIFSEKSHQHFLRLAETFEAEALCSYVRELFAPLLSKFILPGLLIKLANNILDVYSSFCDQINTNIITVSTSNEKYKQIQLAPSADDIPQIVCDYIRDTMPLLSRNVSNRITPPIKFACAYIGEHYSERITLQNVANQVYLSPQYFCELFKQEIGENFSDYLANFRIDISKKLLRNIRYKIKDINEMVGYKDSKSFSKLFKKRVGISPIEYRKLYS